MILLAYLITGILGVTFLYHRITFYWLPDYYIHKLSNSPHYENPHAVRCLERLTALPAIGGVTANRQTRFRLANAYRLTRRYDDAAALYTSLLSHPSNSTFRTIVHSRLAECLEGTKNLEGAAANRAQASELWPGAQLTAKGCMELGTCQ
ncbi:MAG: tetratricopeptide repeat protein [Capsulimonas sp.]|uniref:tetratricopeptide repeat protein n=1 Tax=Capsulimonas sp. TaxID=2494211 RepID=UPI003264D7FB